MMTTDLPSAGRALVPLAGHTRDAHPHRPIRRAASFIAQLLASTGRLPQAREKRRAEPTEVIAAYRATVDRLRRLGSESE
jgi:hypothetical protein